VLVHYEQLLGLAIPQQDMTYFKTITRFQLMVSLDLVAIFVAFLVQSYYLLLVNYLELPPEDERNEGEQRIAETYEQFVDFKLTSWLSHFSIYSALRVGCDAFLEAYFPLLGLAACLFYSITMGLYLLIGLFFYLNLNLAYYRTHVDSSLMHHVL
jgi:hypothetical protein